MTRRRTAAAMLAAAFAIGVAGVYATANPRGYVALYPLDQPYTVFAATWLLAIVGLVLLRPPRRVVALLALPAAAAFYVTGFATVFEEALRSDDYVVRTVASPNGRYEARVVAGVGFFDEAAEVRIRTRRGVLSTDHTVWSASEVATVDVRFTGPHRIEIAHDGTVDVATY